MAAGLSNADFRALLATPRHGAAGRGGGSKEGKEPRKHKKPGGGGGRGAKGGAKPGAKEGEEDEGDKYRDRAEERRKGLSADFEGVPDDLVGLLEGKADLRGVSYEDSKYLGGDVAHTHLVKGLDFALLQKVRAEQEAKQQGGEGEDEGAPKTLAKTVTLQGQQAPATFQTPMGRAVHAFFFDPKQRGLGVPVAELFLPRRTAFVYELDDAAAPDIPTTLRRSKEDCPKVQESMLGGIDGGVLEKIAKIMSYMTVQGGGKKKLKRREREALLSQHGIALQGALKHAGIGGGGGFSGAAAEVAAAAAAEEAPLQGPAPPADDGDIFGDAGTDYEPTLKDRQKAAAAAEQRRRGGYFGGAQDLHADLPPLPAEDAPPLPPEEGDTQGPAPGPARPPSGYDAGAAYAPYPEAEELLAAAATGEGGAAEAARQERGKEKRRAADVIGGDDDAYAECYPSYYDYGVTVEDSDEEGGPPGAQQGALTRRDFASDADWEEYQAAGQPSRQAEGRAKVRQQQRVASKEKNKITSQLGKIQKIMEDKGYEHGAAFAKGAGPRGGGGEEGSGSGMGGGGSGGSFTKKRRI